MMSRGRGRPPHPEILTPAEQRVLDELRKGGTNAEIAERLGVTLDAVKYHISNMLAKLELDNRRELAAWRPERRRLLGVLAVPAWFDSLGRSLGWAGAALGIAAVVAILLVVLSSRGGVEQRVAAPPTPSVPADPAAAPTPSGPDDPAVQLFAPRDLMCAVLESGALTCWVSGYVVEPSLFPTGDFRTADSGERGLCGIRQSGELTCWGFGDDGEWVEQDTPPGTYRSVSIGTEQTCALAESGEITCWPHVDDRAVVPSGRFRAIDAGPNLTCGIRESGEIACWGFGSGGPESLGEAPPGTYRALDVGESDVCALRESGEVVCWGRNAHGEADAPPGTYRAVTVHTCALRESGEIECWGDNALQAEAPTGQFRSVSASSRMACGIRDSGESVCWGHHWNWPGQTRSRPASWCRCTPS